MQKDDQLYWLISVPNTKEKNGAFDYHVKKTEKEQRDLCKNFRFPVPELRVGTLDALMALSDDLGKIDLFVEGVTRKIARQLFEVLKDSEAVNTVSLMLSVNGGARFAPI